MACHPLGLQVTRLHRKLSGAFLSQVGFAKQLSERKTPGRKGVLCNQRLW